MKPIISFITVNYNGYKDTCELISSIFNNVKNIAYEIIVVDNASVKNEAEMIQSQFHFVKVIRSEENLGFAGGNNLGIKKASADYLFFINNDTIFSDSDNNLNRLVQFMEEHQEVGALSPQIKDAESPNRIQFAGFTKLSPITLRNRTINYSQQYANLHNKMRAIPYLHGAAMVIRKEVIEEVGLMPEIYFLYYEEIDWSVKITKLGYQIWYYPEVKILHKESQSTGKETPLKYYYMTRNRLIFAKRNRNKREAFCSILYQISIVATRDILKNICKGRLKNVSAINKGILDFFKLKL